MAITRDQILGSNHANIAAGSTLVITTGATAAAGSRIVVAVSWFDSVAHTLSCSDGSAYTQDKLVTNGSDKFAIFSRVLVGSLASGSSITLTMSAAFSGGILAGAASYLGTTATDTSSSNTTTGTTWSSGSATNAIADSLFIGGAGNETTTTTTSTPTNGTELVDIWDSGAQQGFAMNELIVSSIASQALTGNWVGASSTATTGALMVYKGTASASTARQFVPSRMPLGA